MFEDSDVWMFVPVDNRPEACIGIIKQFNVCVIVLFAFFTEH
jgi:hypothetical protein